MNTPKRDAEEEVIAGARPWESVEQAYLAVQRLNAHYAYIDAARVCEVACRQFPPDHRSVLPSMAAQCSALAATMPPEFGLIRDSARAYWRRRALEWMQRSVTQVESNRGSAGERSRIHDDAFLDFTDNAAFDPFRRGEHFDGLPESEKAAWAEVWKRVSALE